AFDAGREVFIVAGELLDDVARKCGIGRRVYTAEDGGVEFQVDDYTRPAVLARFPGSRLERLEARHAWPRRPSRPLLGDRGGRGVLLFDEPYAHRYPHCWRCKNPVIFRATPQWFISLDAAARDSVEFERDDDGRDRSNFTENEEDAPESLRAMALREIENVEW